MTPTQGEHAQTAAQVQRYKIGYPTDSWGERSSTPSGIPDHAGAWVRYEDHAAQVAALAAAPQGGVYAELPPRSELGMGLMYEPVEGFTADDMRSYADATHALRVASNGQAPAGAAPEPIAYLHDDGYWTPTKTAEGRKLNDRLHFAGSPKIGVHLAPTAQAAPATTDFTTLSAAVRAIRQAIELIGEPADDRMRAARRVLRGAVIVAEDSGELAAPAAGAVAGPSLQEIQWRNIRKVVDALADFCFGSQDDPRWGVAHVAIRTSLTAKDGLDVQALKLEPLAAPTPATQADSQPAPQGETNVQLDTDSNHSAPGQQRDMACSLALGQPMGNGQDQAAGHLGAQGDKLLTVAERNIRSFLRSATFKSESDREAALNCVDVLWAAARAPADSMLEDAERLLRQILAASQDGDSDTHLSAHFVSRIETITKPGGAA